MQSNEAQVPVTSENDHHEQNEVLNEEKDSENDSDFDRLQPGTVWSHDKAIIPARKNKSQG